MAIDFPQTDGTGPLKIAGAIDIYDANLLRERLQQYLEEHSEILLDLSDVESCDLSTIQLLYAAYKSAQKLNRQFSVVAISPAAGETFTRLGLTPDQLGVS
jgi:anti-anti-sigma factor